MKTTSLLWLLASVFVTSASAHAQSGNGFHTRRCQEPASVFYTLGTNSGPLQNPERAEPANYLSYGQEGLLIDVGDGATDQLGKVGVAIPRVTAVLLSHLHFDHTGGLFGFLSRRYQTKITAPLTIYGPVGTQATVDQLVEAMTAKAGTIDLFSTLSPDPSVGLTVVELTDGSQFDIGSIRVTAAVNTHYSLTDPTGAGEHSFAFRFDMPDRSIVYTGDTGPSEAIEELASHVDLLVAEIMDPDESLARLLLQYPDSTPEEIAATEAHFRKQHLSPEEVGKMASRARCDRLILTHNAISYDNLPAAKERIATYYARRITFARDLQQF